MQRVETIQDSRLFYRRLLALCLLLVTLACVGPQWTAN